MQIFVACSQTLFYFSFRSFRKHRRASSSSPTPLPFALAVNKSPAVFVFYHARSTDFEEKIEQARSCEQARFWGLLSTSADR